MRAGKVVRDMVSEQGLIFSGQASGTAGLLPKVASGICGRDEIPRGIGFSSLIDTLILLPFVPMDRGIRITDLPGEARPSLIGSRTIAVPPDATGPAED